MLMRTLPLAILALGSLGCERDKPGPTTQVVAPAAPPPSHPSAPSPPGPGGAPILGFLPASATASVVASSSAAASASPSSSALALDFGPEPFAKIPNALPKSTPQQISFKSCPPEGNGGDKKALNLAKNRVDRAARYFRVLPSAVLALPAKPSEVYEGMPVAVEGFLVDAKQEGGESPNCHASSDKDIPKDEIDFHLFLSAVGGDPKDLKKDSIVVEITPRVRKDHEGWDFAAIKALTKQPQRKVRISGFLMYDPEHANQLGKTRATLWEIHPITKIELDSQDGWTEI